MTDNTHTHKDIPSAREQFLRHRSLSAAPQMAHPPREETSFPIADVISYGWDAERGVETNHVYHLTNRLGPVATLTGTSRFESRKDGTAMMYKFDLAGRYTGGEKLEQIDGHNLFTTFDADGHILGQSPTPS